MGTRGSLTFVHNGVEHTVYNHYDSYPEGLGATILSWIDHTKDFNKIRALVDNLTPVSEDDSPTQEQLDLVGQRAGLTGSTNNDWYTILRPSQGNIDLTLKAGYYADASYFPGDSLFCEWAYVIDLDKEIFEVHRGFQSTPHTQGRFALVATSVNGYYPVKLVWSRSFYSLPDVQTFVDELAEAETKSKIAPGTQVAPGIMSDPAPKTPPQDPSSGSVGTTRDMTVADLDGSDDAADWVTSGHVLTAEEAEYIRSLRIPWVAPIDLSAAPIEKCAECHLFIEENSARLDLDGQPIPGIAEYVHLHRGDDADSAIDESHEAKPSGLMATLNTWKVLGPAEMRARFTS